MTIKRTYIACDGVEFENREDCLAHEADINEEIEILSECRFFDSTRRPIKCTAYEHLSDIADKSEYMYVASEAAIRILATLFADYGVECPWSDDNCKQRIGHYAYMDRCGWVCLEEHIEETKKIIHIMDRE